VIVTAIGGEHARSGADRFARDVLPLRPDLVTIDYGLNGLGLEAAGAAWSAMIAQTLNAGARLLLLTPTPDTTQFPGAPSAARALLRDHAQQIRGLADAHGSAWSTASPPSTAPPSVRRCRRC
jgi:acyl-CoA thioesterase I